MKLIVGLGNPGQEYEATWHNLGFMVIDKLSERSGSGRFRNEAEAKVQAATVAGERVLLVKPQTYMNLSGNSVQQLLHRYAGGDAAQLIVVVDDTALPLGMIRVRAHGSAGGHNGLKSIIARLGTQEFMRVRLGVKPDHPVSDTSDFVLSPVPKPLRESVIQMVERATDAIEVILAEGIERAMAAFNERITGAGPETNELPCSGR